jgi:hypothetical protein
MWCFQHHFRPPSATGFPAIRPEPPRGQARNPLHICRPLCALPSSSLAMCDNWCNWRAMVDTTKSQRGLASVSPSTSAWLPLILTVATVTTLATLATLSLTACGKSDPPPSASATAGTQAVTNAQTTTKAACGKGTPPCDPKDLGGATCESTGAGSGTLLCDPVTCTFDTTMCVPAAPTMGSGGMGATQPTSGTGTSGDGASGAGGVTSVSGSGGANAAGSSGSGAAAH